MRLYFSGHNDKYAVEQTMLMLFPEERPEYSEERPGGDNELELSLHTGKRFLTASAVLRRNGLTFRRLCRAKRLPDNIDSVTENRLRRRTLQRALYRAAVDCTGVEPPWGMLSGVRPVKLPVRAVQNGASLAQAEAQLRDAYRVSSARRALAMDCAKASLKVKNSLLPNEISLYIGIPFCPTRCAYCSFVSSAGQNNRLVTPYLEVLHEEIAAAGSAVKKQGLSIRSVYIGGGTPTTLSSQNLFDLLQALRTYFPLQSNLEFTVEAGRPDTITREKLVAIKQGGGNRISVNPQSMSDRVLCAMGRAHSAKEVLTAWDLVRSEGFSCVNMDLIAGLPEDSLTSFQSSLEQILSLSPENITVHTLALKKGSRLMEDGSHLPDGAEVSLMLDYAWSCLRKEGFLPYYLYRQKFMSGGFENVGWCKPGYESDYNICMMEELHTVLSLGAGGVTKQVRYAEGSLCRLSNPKYPQEYIRDRKRILEEKLRFAP